MEFYKNVGKSLFLFNLISIFFLILTIFGYSLLQYLFIPLVSITNMLFSDPAVVESVLRVLDLALIIPTMLDYAFLLLVITLVFDLLLISWRTKTGNLIGTMAFTLIGLPIWVYIMTLITDIKSWALNFLGSAITYNLNLRFYSFIQNNSLELSIMVFLLAIAIRSIDFDNIKFFKSNGENISGQTDINNLNDIIQQ